jgi:hypothetical protein
MIGQRVARPVSIRGFAFLPRRAAIDKGTNMPKVRQRRTWQPRYHTRYAAILEERDLASWTLLKRSLAVHRSA